MNTHVIADHENGAIDRAVEQLISGELVALPTETVYGLAADALNDAAVHKIYNTKGRPSNNPLICHVSDGNMAERFVEVNETAHILMQTYWPGPLTLVLPQVSHSGLPGKVSAGLDTLAVRCPKTKITRNIISQLSRPIAAPSANPSGKLSPTCAADVVEGLDGKIPLIIDGGTTAVGIESTIIGVQGQKLTLLRPGSITVDEISETTGLKVYDRDQNTITAPGQLVSHYAPNAPVKLGVNKCETGDFFIGFGTQNGKLNLSPDGDLAEAAKNLFAMLRSADKQANGAIAVAPIPMKGIGIAINDRLRRAAAPRG